MSDAFVARFVLWRRVLAVLACAGFVAGSLWIAGLIGRNDEPDPLVGAVGIVVFGGFGLVGLWRLRMTGDAVRIDGVGIWLRRAEGGMTIPWHAVQRVAVQQVRRQRFLCLWLDDPDRYRSAGLAGRMARANVALGFGDVAVTVAGTDRGFDDLEAAAARFAPTRLID